MSISKIILKTIKIILIIVILLVVVISSIIIFEELAIKKDFGAGVLFPKFDYSVYHTGKEWYWGASECLELANSDMPEIDVLISRSVNSFKYDFEPRFLTKKPYDKLFVKSIKYIWDDKEQIVLGNKTFNIGTDWITSDNSKYYWRNGYIGNGWKWPHVNFSKLFKDKKAGDKFLFKVVIDYYFDNDDEKQVVLDYEVHVIKAKYSSPFC